MVVKRRNIQVYKYVNSAFLSNCAHTQFLRRGEGVTNIFARVTETYGEDQARDAIAIIDRYVDVYYPYITGKSHDPMSRPKRMTFAEKLLNCAGAFGLALTDMKRLLVAVLECTCQEDYDPNIYYATSPRVLGYWLYSELDIDLGELCDTPYMPVDIAF